VSIRAIAGALSAVLFPAPCRICDTLLTNASRIPICDRCLDSFERISEPMCQCCGRPFMSPHAADAIQPLCRLCRTGAYAFDRARSYGVYDDALSAAVVLLKYEGVKPLGDWFAGRLAEVVEPHATDWRIDLVVPVPLHPGRLRERGYNQAERIAKPLAKKLKLRFGSYLLVRTKPRPAQLILSRTERWTSVRGAYATHERARVDNLRILLVDDVLTTGATLDACSRALKKAGAAAVFAITVARVVPGWWRPGSVPSQERDRETVPAERASL
jgi:ComF family protein